MIVNDDVERAATELEGIVREALDGAGTMPPMIHPRIDELLENVDSRYALVIVAAKRARQINNYHHQLGEGTLRPVPAAAGRVALEELLDHVPRGNRRGQDQVRVHLEVAPARSGEFADRLPEGTMCRWRACSSGSPAGSPPTRPASSCGCSSRRDTRSIPLLTAEAETVRLGEDLRALARRSRRARTSTRISRRRPARDRAAHGEHAREARARARGQRRSREAALAHRGPVLVAPAMNPRMWANPATQANVEALRARGVELVGPEEGETAEGESGVGRMAEPEEIFGARRRCSRSATSSRGRRVLVTAGGTREPLDAVRFLGNRSSGRMGVAPSPRRRAAAAPTSRSSPRTSRCRLPHGVDVVAGADRRRRRPGDARPRRRRRGRDGRCRRRLPPGRGRAGEAPEGRPAVDGRRSSRRPTSCASSARGARTASCSSASPPIAESAGSSARGRSSSNKRVDLSSSTT